MQRVPLGHPIINAANLGEQFQQNVSALASGGLGGVALGPFGKIQNESGFFSSKTLRHSPSGIVRKILAGLGAVWT